MRSIAFALTLLVGISTAAAQAAPETQHRRSPGKALAWSAVGTGASVALVGVAGLVAVSAPAGRNNELALGIGAVGATGFLVAPSFGHIYGADCWWTTGAKLRLLGAGLGGVGLFVAAATFGPADGELSTAGKIVGYGALTTMFAGAGLVVVGVVHDIATAESATERFNRDRGFSLSLAPTAIRTPGNATVAGLGIVGRF